MAEVIVAIVPLNLTVFWLMVVLKPVPEIVTVVPTGPVVGLNAVMVGAGFPTVNAVLLVNLPVGVVTLIGPVVAPGGTLVTI